MILDIYKENKILCLIFKIKHSLPETEVAAIEPHGSALAPLHICYSVSLMFL